MKQPATRVVRATRQASTTRVVRVTRHAEKAPHRRSRLRGLRPLLILLIVGLTVWWVVHQLSGSGGAAATDALRRVLGVATSAPNGTSAPGPPTAILGGGAGAAGSSTPSSLSVATASRTPAAVATKRPSTTATPRPRATVKPASPLLTPALKALPATQLLQNDYQVFETWNNCGPASLSMALSYFGINESQAVLGNALRPYQNSVGDNDDKDVTMEELAAEARKFGLLAYYRPNGNIHLLKQFVALGVPVIAETVMTMDDDIGHYRVVKGYNDAAGTITQDDSIQGHNVQYSFADFDYMWKKYNYEYLVLVPKDKQRQAEAILGKNLNPRAAWQATAAMDRAMLVRNPSDVDSGFNLSVALYYLGKYRQSVRQFEAVQSRLPFRTLWYQIEPIEAYYALGDYQTVIALSDQVLNSGDRAFSQLYILLGEIDKKQGNIPAARAEFQNAVYYNTNLKAARDALQSVS